MAKCHKLLCLHMRSSISLLVVVVAVLMVVAVLVAIAHLSLGRIAVEITLPNRS
jgi:hypothetical protein